MKNKLVVSLFAALVSAAAVRAQSALDGFDPSANGAIQAIVVQPDGKILIGGAFTTLTNGGVAVTRNRIARLNPDGTLDSTFNPDVSGGGFPVVYAIALQPDGKIVAGGDFTTAGGQTRNRIARLDPVTGLADSFDPNASGIVRAIAIQSDGKILASGSFTSIGGQTRNRVARLDAVTGAADSFDPNANNLILALAVQTDGKILVGGGFTSIGGQTRNNIARLDATTGLADSFNPNASSFVFSVATQADGKILAGGVFTSMSGQTRNNIARLDAATGLADSFNPNANNAIYSIVVQPDGKILAGGDFNGADSIGGATRNRIARLDPTTGLADSFDPNANNTVTSIAVQADGKILMGGFFITNAPNGGAAIARSRIARLQTDGRLDQTLNLSIVGIEFYAIASQPDGKILIGGLFSSVQGTTRNNIARLNPDGTLDSLFNPNANSAVYSIAVQTDGKILVGGFFTNIAGQVRNHIARLDGTTGSADSFNPNANHSVNAIAVQPDGKILVGGDFDGFNSIGGETRNGIARLDATTGLADSFNPNADNSVHTIAVQADGKILVGGQFNSIGGQARNGIARLDAATSLADSFNPDANSDVRAIAIQADGKILAVGDFNGANSIGGQTRNRIARLDTTTGLADSFNPNANKGLYTIAVQADGKILASGVFSSIGGQTRNRLARLDGTTGLADSFDPNANGSGISGFESTVFSIAVQADGKILAGGNFTNIGGATRKFFARLSNDTTAPQNLAVLQNTITWTLGGSSPQFTRVTFESSTNNVNYTPLGSGAAAGSNWTLTGLNLPTGQNIYIRARGFYRSGVFNGSESITESVRNVFFVARPLLNIQLSANTNVLLSWATNFTGFTLEANTNLTTNVWSTVSPAPAVSGTNNVVTNTASDSARFYRLRKP